MSKGREKSTNTEEVPEQEVVDAQADAEAETPPEDEVTKLRREVEELRDKNLRLVAEQQNLQKRALRDKQEALRYAESAFATQLLVVLDDFDRTFESAQSATDVAVVADGMRIVYEHFLKVLQQHGIQPIDALGKPFDPSYHEAMMQQPSEEHPAGTILQEMARGYTMHDRVLRPSRVIVSGGPPSSGGDSQPEANEE